MKQILARHNKKIIAKNQPKAEERECNCPRRTREAGECPLQGRCLTKNYVYQATVVETTVDNQEKVETYVGVCATTFKERLGNHTKSFNNPKYKGDTILSSHIWDLKAYSIAWKVIDRGTPFTPINNQCMLCTKEKFYILRKPKMASKQKAGGWNSLSPCCHVSSVQG